MSAGYRLSSEAQRDLVEIAAYYRTVAGAALARRMLAAIGAAFRRIAQTPGIGHNRNDLTDQPVKFWPMPPYLIVYDPATTPIGIARVLHASLDVASHL